MGRLDTLPSHVRVRLRHLRRLTAPNPPASIDPMLFLNRKEVEALLDLGALIDALAVAMAEVSSGDVSQPPRIAAQVKERDGNLLVMPAYLPGSGSLAVKLVSVFPQNHELGIPSHQALIAVFDAATGSPAAVMDGEHITAMRTAAGSALATRLLARPDASVLAILGTGVQAKAHALAIPRVRSITEIRIAGRDVAKAKALADEVSDELGVTAQGTSSFQDAVSGSDVICACTHAESPVLLGRWLAPGAHVNSVGLNFQGREMDDETIRRSRVFVESRNAALAPAPAGANDLTWPIRDGVINVGHVLADIGELVTGAHPGRTSDDQITLYKSVGVAAQDAVTARLVLSAAIEKGVGLNIAM